jgi:hypothetical protein
MKMHHLFSPTCFEPQFIIRGDVQRAVVNIVACRAVSRQGLGKHVPPVADTHAAIEILLEAVFYTRSVQGDCKEDN